jgi:hypothetical protein
LFCIILLNVYSVIGGNARDLAREKNQKKQQEIAKKKGIADKGSNAGLTLEQRKQRCVKHFQHIVIMKF